MVDPQVPATVYAAAGVAGVFKSNNGGTSWIASSTGLAGASVAVLAIDPQNPQTIYAGTYGAGIFRSTDGGAYWSAVNNGIPIQYIPALAIDPQTPSIVYAGTSYGGVYKSVNGGASWSAINTGITNIHIRVLAIDPKNPDRLYTGTTGSNGGIFRSTDGGASWSAVNNGLAVTEIRALAVDPQNPANLYMATYDNAKRYYPDRPIALSKSTDGGETWNEITNEIWAYELSALAIDPQIPSIVYAGTTYGGVYKSVNGGASWSVTNSGLGNSYYYPKALAINPQNPATVYAGTYDGIFRSTDGGASWTSINSGITALLIQTLTIDPQNPAAVFLGTPSGILKSLDACANWRVMSNGLGARRGFPAVAINPQNPAVLYAGTNDGSSPAVFKSTDGGESWISNYSGSPSDVNALAIDPQNPQRIYAGTRSNYPFYRSDDGGNSWQNISQDPWGRSLGYISVYTLAINPQKTKTIYAGAYGGMLMSPNGWSWLHLYAFAGGTAKTLAINPQTPDTIYVGTESGVFKSTDGGSTWNPIIDGLTNTNVTALAIHPQNPGIIFAGTNGGGVFESTNAGLSWSALNTGFSDLRITALAIDASGQKLYAGVTGSGVWVYTLQSSQSSNITITTNPPGQTFSVDGAVFTDSRTFAWTAGSSHTISTTSPQGTGGTRRVFESWSDGGSIDHTIITPETATTYTASFTTQFLLTTASSPPAGGTVAANPSSQSAFYASGTQVQLTASANSGYVFSGWGGDLSGPLNPQDITMTAPRSVTANFMPQGASTNLAVPAGGAATWSTTGSGDLRTGFAVISANSGATPYGTAVFSFVQNGAVVSEAGVPATPPTSRARVFIDYRNLVNAIPVRSDGGTVNINTGIAIVNYGAAAANITYTLRGPDGNSLTVGHGTLAAWRHMACFIDQLKDSAPDFDLPADFPSTMQFGSLDIEGDQPLSVVALRGTMNQRNEFLLTTTPVADLTQSPGSAPVYFPQFADGGGYTTSLILLNTTGMTETGIMQIRDGNGNPFIVNPVGGTAGSTFRYSIAPGGLFHLQTDGYPAETRAGWVELTPDAGTPAPVGSGVFGYNPADILVSESGIPSSRGTRHARVYVDLSENHNTGLALANVSGSESAVTINAFQKDGVTTAGTSNGPVLLSAGGYEASFADQFVAGLPEGFRGVLDISSTRPFAALTLRSLINERDEFLMTTFPVADADRTAPSPLVFPQIADGGGYKTEFILLGPNGAANTILWLYDESGSPMDFGY